MNDDEEDGPELILPMLLSIFAFFFDEGRMLFEKNNFKYGIYFTWQGEISLSACFRNNEWKAQQPRTDLDSCYRCIP
ncbi:hypothetical protein C5167_025082 [Papaver somniferum]|uniref:Uncharacterized protein n=1 Tax=Papaver somniferum TaxID=3469 RepID=A0A4Y7JU51_PAPSO|nr:hypothetical protein C5167_025082 [Papaver somniferum]